MKDHEAWASRAELYGCTLRSVSSFSYYTRRVVASARFNAVTRAFVTVNPSARLKSDTAEEEKARERSARTRKRWIATAVAATRGGNRAGQY